MTSADLCRERGWGPGTRLVGARRYGTDMILITAVGERNILARRIERNGKPDDCGYEATWWLFDRDWREVPDPHRPFCSHPSRCRTAGRCVSEIVCND